MSFAACFLIPIYNHGRSIRVTVERLERYALPIFVVNDGSDDATRQVLATLAVDFPRLRLFSFAAKWRQRGCCHAWHARGVGGWFYPCTVNLMPTVSTTPTMSAFPRTGSGQSAGADLRQARIRRSSSLERPILWPLFNVHFWVCVETLNLSATDSMCGFRLYPLAACCALINRVKLPSRMDFDIEILVRLAWAGLGFKVVDTRVIYPDDGVSHFDMLRDNLRISKMHATDLRHGAALALAAGTQTVWLASVAQALVETGRTRQRAGLENRFCLLPSSW